MHQAAGKYVLHLDPIDQIPISYWTHCLFLENHSFTITVHFIWHIKD